MVRLVYFYRKFLLKYELRYELAIALTLRVYSLLLYLPSSELARLS